MSRLRDQRGQTMLLVILLMGLMLGMAGVSIDVGAWFVADRKLQAAADAAALAGAQELPNAGQAETYATDYANTNGTSLTSVGVVVTTLDSQNDTIDVDVAGTAPSFFARIFGFDSVNVGAHAQARSALIEGANSVAPIVVNDTQPELQCYLTGGGPNCYGSTVTLNLLNLKKADQAGPTPAPSDGAGQFSLLNLDGGNCDEGELGGFITGTADAGTLYPNRWYGGCPSAKYNSSSFIDAMESKYYSVCGCEVLLPIWDYEQGIQGSGSNAQYFIVGWVGFRITDWDPHGSTAKLTGYFTEVVWDGITTGGGSPPDFGARTILLTK
jgi:hypothetical protein